MKMKSNTPTTLRRISSMKELKHEKARLHMETRYTEERIKGEYRLLIDAFTIRNLVQMAMDEVLKTSNVFSQAFQIGKSLFKKRKKKKNQELSAPVHEGTQGQVES
jgi:hypothetical protein